MLWHDEQPVKVDWVAVGATIILIAVFVACCVVAARAMDGSIRWH